MNIRINDNDNVSHVHRAALAARSIATSAVVALSLLGVSGCVADFGGDTDDGAYLDQEDLGSSAHEVVHGDRVRILAAHSLKCLDLQGGSPHNGAPLTQWDCWGGQNQRFYVYVQPDGYWTIVPEMSGGKCLELVNTWQDGELVRQYDCHGGDSQRFALEHSAGSYFIRPKSNGKCLDVPGYSWTNGVGIIQFGCGGVLNQRFYIENN